MACKNVAITHQVVFTFTAQLGTILRVDPFEMYLKHSRESARADQGMSYQPKKAAQLIAALILKSAGNSINILKAIKLVYLADRESIRRYGFPILDEDRYSMPNGPVNSTTYRHVNGEVDLQACGWSDYLEDRANHKIALAKPGLSIDDLEELSDADVECIDRVWSDFGHMDQWQLVDWTHNPDNVPEWEDPNGGSIKIPYRRILNAVGVENADEVEAIIKAQREIDAAFDQARVH